MRTYGYEDPQLVSPARRWTWGRYVVLLLGLLVIFSFWMALDQKLLFGGDWISETYDNEDWRTNEGNLHTFGAWDLEAHIWKTEHIMEHFPNFHWNPYWYLGMPLLKYYQIGFYAVHWAVIAATGLSPARASLVLIIFSHLLATLLTFLVCYKVSRRIWVSALCSVFLIANTFISVRSYGWEPITVVFLFLYPLGLLLFLKAPLRPFRFWLILVTGLAYLSHPLLWFTLLMMMGLYILSVTIRNSSRGERGSTVASLWEYLGVVIGSILIGAVQFIPQFSYSQASSGAHMGVTYLPFYQVPFNIITLKDFFFDAGNLKGPGPIIMIAFFLLIVFGALEYLNRKKPLGRMIRDHEMVSALTFVLCVMILFYYLELYNIFPMNMLRSIQYHRIIPEFIITAAVLVAAMSNIAHSFKHKLIYYTILVTFVIASSIVVYNVQAMWETTDDISHKQEFIYEPVAGRISFPYTDQSLSVRNSFTKIPQAYGYYEQGITNAYNDEIFSVSSGFHNADLTILYLKAANIGRLYVNMEEGERDLIVRKRLNGSLEFVEKPGRYSYFAIPLIDPSFSQAISTTAAAEVETLEMGCRELFKEHYCGSRGEEFVSTDKAEIAYLTAYVELLETPYTADAKMQLKNSDLYSITVRNASKDTSIVVKMTYDHDFVATIDGTEVPVAAFGPDFMLITPEREGDYVILLEYHINKGILLGGAITIISLIGFIILFASKYKIKKPKKLNFPRGDM